jgi:hypothetical protein
MSMIPPLARPVRGTSPTGAWLALSQDLSEISTIFSGREDLLVHIAPGLGQGAPACFIHSEALIEIDGDVLDIPVQDARPFELAGREDWAATWGLLVHECAHSAHTNWKPAEWVDRGLPARYKPEWLDAAALLDECRVESRQLEARPYDRRWLRASVRRWLLSDAENASGTEMACRLVALVGGRVLAGVLDDAEAEAVLVAGLPALTPAVVAQLQDILTEFLAMDDDDTQRAMELGRRWHETARAARSEEEKAAEEMCQELARAVGELSRRLGEPSGGPPGAQTEREVRKDARRAADRVFREPPDSQSHGYGFSYAPGHMTKPYGWRDPEVQERNGARRLAAALRSASVRERAATPVRSALPPGRPRMSASLQRDAQEAAGAIPSAEPWRRVQRSRTPTPPLRVGLLVDVSGSMAHWIGIASSIAWQVCEATRMIPDARAAYVAFGETVFPVIAPRQHRTVPILAADAGHERFVLACEAVDHELGLSVPGNARLLVVTSDAVYGRSNEGAFAFNRVDRLMKSGCRVIWLDDKKSQIHRGTARPVFRLPVQHIILDAEHDPQALSTATAAVVSAVLRVMRET